MAERKPAKKGTQKSAKRTAGKASTGFTAEEKAAMKERAKEQRLALVLFVQARSPLARRDGGSSHTRALRTAPFTRERERPPSR